MTRRPEFQDTSRPIFLEPVLKGRLRRKYHLAVALAALGALFFWSWWLQPGHATHAGRYLLATFVLAWQHILVAYFIYFFLKSCRPVLPDPGLLPTRVAMVVTKAPSEPFEVVRETLEGMLAQDLPHDTWLADEDPQPETLAWCAANGVRVSTRRDRPDYHNPAWPRRTRCKEGNLAFFYDHYGYAGYEVVAQLDADHVPQPGYLREMLKPFADPRVGYVSAPSICSSNADKSWAARARLHTEALFHGIFQAGCSNGWAPMCIGSHYAVRTAALKEIGGLGPELAEDHSTSMIMNAHGWRGVHALDAIAYGAGPDSLADMVTQEFQWSRSLVTLLLRYTPNYLAMLRPRLRFQFLFCQFFYIFTALSQLAMFLMPVLALATDSTFAEVTYPAFIAHAAPQVMVLTWIALEARRDRLFRPLDASVMSWEKMLFAFLQWPWVLIGTLSAVRDVISGTFVDFRITPKGARGRAILPWRVLTPYALLAIIPIGTVLWAEPATQAGGFYLLALFNALIYALIVAVIVARHARENGFSWRLSLRELRLQGLTAAALLLLLAGGAYERGLFGLHAVTTGLGPLQMTEIRFHVAGAGHPQGRMQVGFKQLRFGQGMAAMAADSSGDGS